MALLLAVLCLCAVGPSHGLAPAADEAARRPLSAQLVATEAVRKAGHCSQAAQDAASRFRKEMASGSSRQQAVSRPGPLRMILM
jgi:hypothetical protein